MEELSTQVVRGFGLKPRNIAKHKLFYICNTDRGPITIRRLRADSTPAQMQAAVLFQHKVKETLYARGFCALDRFFLSMDREPFVLHEGQLYVATAYAPQREVNFASGPEFGQAVAQVGRMHRLSRSMDAGPCPYASDPISAEESYQKNLQALISLKKRVSRYRQLSDFDVLFLRHYEDTLAYLGLWRDYMKQSQCDQRVQNAIAQGMVCHQLLKEEFLIFRNGELTITNFSECAYGYPAQDLASLIRRHFKAAPDNPLDIRSILTTYSAANPLEPGDLEALYAILLFPDKFIKICTQYYTKKRTWIPGTFQVRMDADLGNKDRFRQYISGILT